MWTRVVCAALCLALAVPAAAEDKPYRVSLVGDGFDGTAWHTGVLIELAPGWKTYWRMPGDSGIPTTLAWTLPEGLKASEIEWPAPERIEIVPPGVDHRVFAPGSRAAARVEQSSHSHTGGPSSTTAASHSETF